MRFPMRGAALTRIISEAIRWFDAILNAAAGVASPLSIGYVINPLPTAAFTNLVHFAPEGRARRPK